MEGLLQRLVWAKSGKTINFKLLSFYQEEDAMENNALKTAVNYEFESV